MPSSSYMLVLSLVTTVIPIARITSITMETPIAIVSRILDNMLLGAIAASLGIWVTSVTITICYLVIRN
jgi:hypothetical protein